MQNLSQAQLKELDLRHIWHPCTQMHDHEEILPLIPIQRAKGIYLYDFEGKSYMDCISSWWVNLFGHCNDYISQKLHAQAQELEHLILAGFSHKPIIELASRLCGRLDSKLQKCFFADNGSSAIEVALKMAYHAKVLENPNLTKGNPLFVSLQNSYHGETLGALSVGDVGIYKDIYEPILLKTLKAKSPNPNEQEALHDLESLLDSHPDIIAFIIEPLVQCAGGMQMHSTNFVKNATLACQKRGVYVIFDEIAVGFGRVGSMFAYQQCGVVPDFLCLSKGISGGYLPLSVVVTSDEVYEKFYAPYQQSHRAFLHSHSYTGNALACACACAVLDIFDSQNVLENNANLSAYMWEKASEIKNFDCVANVRQRGMIFAFDIVGFEGERKGVEVYNKALAKGLLLRPLGNTIYLMPPFIITKEQIDYIFLNLYEILRTL
ncbi:adenosylmethionine--8-amino-7-oxononanoate transaminase [Helicobacter sp. 23-1048]